MISALDDILEDYKVYLRVEQRSEGIARGYSYSVGRFLKDNCIGFRELINSEVR